MAMHISDFLSNDMMQNIIKSAVGFFFSLVMIYSFKPIKKFSEYIANELVINNKYSSLSNDDRHTVWRLIYDIHYSVKKNNRSEEHLNKMRYYLYEIPLTIKEMLLLSYYKNSYLKTSCNIKCFNAFIDCGASFEFHSSGKIEEHVKNIFSLFAGVFCCSVVLVFAMAIIARDVIEHNLEVDAAMILIISYIFIIAPYIIIVLWECAFKNYVKNRRAMVFFKEYEKHYPRLNKLYNRLFNQISR